MWRRRFYDGVEAHPLWYADWQRGQLPDEIYDLVLGDQRLRNDIGCSVFDC